MLAINLAAALHRMGESTLLVDANLRAPHVGVSLGSGMHACTLHDVLAGGISAVQSVHYHDSGLKIVPGDMRLRNHTSLDYKKIADYKKLADYVFYDSSPTHHDHIWHAADQALVVTQPQFPALADALRIINEVKERQDVLVGVVLNKAGKHDLSVAEVEKYLGLPVIASLPYDERIDEALKHRAIYSDLFPQRKTALAIKELAYRIAGKPLQ